MRNEKAKNLKEIGRTEMRKTTAGDYGVPIEFGDRLTVGRNLDACCDELRWWIYTDHKLRTTVGAVNHRGARLCDVTTASGMQIVSVREASILVPLDEVRCVLDSVEGADADESKYDMPGWYFLVEQLYCEGALDKWLDGEA
jgi:hypothetical protein